MFHLFKQSIVMGFAPLLVVLYSLPSASGQTTSDPPSRTQPSSATVTAASSNGSVRFSAPGNTTEIRLEVFSPTGEKVFDSGTREGNVLDWRWQDQNARVLSADGYLCIVTVQSLSGRTSRKLAHISFANQEATLQPIEAAQLSPAQAQVVGATETDTPLTIITSEQPIATTVIAHDGIDGQMIRGRGALSFRIGNFFSGIDQEQMRLTEAGNLGIGTSEPKARLDVAGTIRAERILIAKPKLASGDKTTAGALAAESGDSVQPLAAGSGTQNQIAKWTDNAGTLGDSGITETAAGNIGIGTTSPTDKLEVKDGFISTYHANSAFGAGYAVNFYTDTTGATKNTIGQIGVVQSATNARSGSFVVNLSNAGVPSEKFRINNLGNVGIGTTSPGAKLEIFGAGTQIKLAGSGTTDGFVGTSGTKLFLTDWATGSKGIIVDMSNGNVGIGRNSPVAKLDVAGNINTSTQYNIAGIRVLDILGSNTFAGVNAGLSNAGTFNTFVGYMAGSSKNGGDGNSFFGSFAGNSNSGGDGNAFFGFEAGKANVNGGTNSFFGSHAGRQNQNAAGNSFFGYLSGEANTSGEFNSFFGKEAGSTNTTGSFNVSIGYAAGTGPFAGNASGTNNVSIGYASGTLTGAGQSGNNNNIFIGAGARGDDQEDDNQPLTYATAIGAGAVATRKNTIFLGRSDLEPTIENPDGGDDVVVGGQLYIKSISHPLGSLVDLCVPDGPHPLGYGVVTCSSSLRYKTGVETFLGGLDIVRRLRPITFNWRAGGRRDLGFGAEEVEKIDPLLVFYNEKNEVEGVKYRQMTAVLVNAINDQQTQITAQQRKIEQQTLQLEQKDSQIESLKAGLAQQEQRLAAIESRIKSLAETKGAGENRRATRSKQ